MKNIVFYLDYNQINFIPFNRTNYTTAYFMNFMDKINSQSTNDLIQVAVASLIDVSENNINVVLTRIRSKIKQAICDEMTMD